MEIRQNGQILQTELPEGFSFRPARLDDVKEITELINNLISRFSIGVDGLKEPLARTEMKSPGIEPDLWFLAKDGEEMAGYVFNRQRSFERDDTGYLRVLGVRRPWRKRGLGLALLSHNFRKFWELGQKRVSLGMDTANITGALRLYEKADMNVHLQFTLYELAFQDSKELTRI